jgi:hypothetical protein
MRIVSRRFSRRGGKMRRMLGGGVNAVIVHCVKYDEIR